MERLAKINAEVEAAKANRAKEAAKGKVARIRDREMTRKAKELLPLTPERAAAVRQAFNQMLADDTDCAELKNGVGFSKPDSAVAHWVLDAGLEQPEQVELAYAMLTRYFRQLGRAFPVLFRG